MSILGFEEFLNEGINESINWKDYPWTFGDIDCIEYDNEKMIEDTTACAKGVIEFLGKDIEILVHVADVSDDLKSSKEHIADIINRAFSTISVRNKFKKAAEPLSWNGNEEEGVLSNNWFSEFSFLENTNLDLRIVVEKGDCGWEAGPYNHDRFVNFIVSLKDLAFFETLYKVNPVLITEFLDATSRSEFETLHRGKITGSKYGIS